jgi:hypothetical protein
MSYFEQVVEKGLISADGPWWRMYKEKNLNFWGLIHPNFSPFLYPVFNCMFSFSCTSRSNLGISIPLYFYITNNYLVCTCSYIPYIIPINMLTQLILYSVLFCSNDL